VSNRGLRVKQLGYRDQSGASQAAHAAHWAGFRFQSGPVQVIAIGSWGQCQVWASSEAEGKRVIRHAAAIGGWDPDNEPGSEWQVTRVESSRYGAIYQVETMDTPQGLRVSKRTGPSGQPRLND
jgi:hypothetical protein